MKNEFTYLTRLINFNFFVLKKCPENKRNTKGKIIAKPPNLAIKTLLSLSRILPSETAKKFFKYAINNTSAAPIRRKPKILKIVCLFIFNFRKGILNNDFLLAIVFYCIPIFFQIQPRL